MTRVDESSSARQAVERFDSPEAAQKYARALVGSATHRREARCIRKALTDVPRGAKVLDLPCGTGRLLPLLLDLDFMVTEADSSPHMLQQARGLADQAGFEAKGVEFCEANALHTPFESDAFDAVVCNRLFHHFREPETRRAALREFRRICTGPIVVSFFCNLAYDSLVFHIRNVVTRNTPDDRIPIGYSVFARDVSAAGLRVGRTLASRPGVSKQWYSVLWRVSEADSSQVSN